MKNIILLSIIALGFLVAPNKTYAAGKQVLEITNAPSNFSKARFSQMLKNVMLSKK